MPKFFEILPTILETTPEACKEKLRVAETASKWIQWDVMDGKFVQTVSFADVEVIKSWKLHSKIELHLQVKDPARVIAAWNSLAAFRRAVWHVEADIEHLPLILQIKESGREVGLAISPKTSLMELTPYIDLLDTVIVMGVEPGISGQTLLPGTQDRVRAVRALNPDIKICVDGGVNAQNIVSLAQAGAMRFSMNSAFYNHPFPRDYLHGQLDSLSYLEA